VLQRETPAKRLHWCRVPRYDLPNAAPEPLRLVQRFVNTIDLSHDTEWLAAFFADEGVAEPAGLDGLLGRVAVVCLETMRDGTWARLKCCRNRDCRWAFYDYSKNRSATWCSMQICGNRTKTRAYRRRTH